MHFLLSMGFGNLNLFQTTDLFSQIYIKYLFIETKTRNDEYDHFLRSSYVSG